MASTITLNRISAAVINEGETLQMSITVTGSTGGDKFRLWFSNQFAGAFTNSLLAAVQTSATANGCTVSAENNDSVQITLGAGSYTITFNRPVGTQIGGTGDQASFAPGNQRQVDVFLTALTPAPTISGNTQAQWITYTAAPLNNGTLPPLSGVVPAVVPLQYAFAPGMNISGGEFSPNNNGGFYQYPKQSDITLWVGRGYKIIRLCCHWNHMIDPATWTWRANDLNLLTTSIDQIIAAGGYVLIDMHSYGYMYPDDGGGSNSAGLIGTFSAPSSNFALLWRMIATQFKNRTNIAWGLSNEPHTQSETDWIAGAQLAINHIRDVGSGHPIFVMHSGWGGAHNYVGSGGTAAAATLTDPCSNLILEGHQYFDSDYSGTHYDDASLTGNNMATLLTPWRDWLRANGAKGFIGEFGVHNSAAGRAKMKQMLDFLDANKDVFVGWTYWGAGALGTGYPLYPIDGGQQLAELDLHKSTTAWSGGATGWPNAGTVTPPGPLSVAVQATEQPDSFNIAAIGPGSISLDFTASFPGTVTLVSTPAGYAKTSTGTLTSFSANTARRTDLGLLVEPSTFNAFAHTNGTWVTANGTATYNVAVAPDGTTTAALFVPNSATAQHIFTQTYSFTNAQPYQISAYVKAAGYNYVTIFNNIQNSNTYYGVSFDLTGNGSVTKSDDPVAVPTIEKLANGWFRISTNAIGGTGTSIGMFPMAAASTNSVDTSTFAGNGSSGINVWGFNATAATMLTSPIIAAGVQTTRAADVYTLVIPSNVNTLTFTFDDNSLQSLPVAPGSYTIPTTLNRFQIKTITSDNSGYLMSLYEATDTAAASVTLKSTLTFSAGDTSDTAVINAVGTPALSLAWSSTEAPDVAAFSSNTTVYGFDPNAKATDVTLSNNNRTYTKTANSDHGSRTNLSFTQRKVYAELEIGTNGGGYVLGVVTSAWSVNTYPGQGTTGYGAVDGGDIRYNAANVGASARLGSTPSNSRMCIAVDGTAMNVWFRNGPTGNWNGSATADPATGAEPISISSLGSAGTALFLACAAFFNARAGTIRLDSSEWTGTAPSGFSALVDQGLGFTLGAIESQDTAVASVNQSIPTTVGATEAKDALAFTVTGSVSGAFAATEVPDPSFFSVDIKTSAALAATGSADTVALIAAFGDQYFLGATEAKDTLAASATTILSGTLAGSEAPDQIIFTSFAGITSAFAMTEAQDTLAASATIGYAYVLAATGAADTAALSATVTLSAALNALESADGMVVSLDAPRQAMLFTSENPDVSNLYGHWRNLAAQTFTRTGSIRPVRTPGVGQGPRNH